MSIHSRNIGLDFSRSATAPVAITPPTPWLVAAFGARCVAHPSEASTVAVEMKDEGQRDLLSVAILKKNLVYIANVKRPGAYGTPDVSLVNLYWLPTNESSTEVGTLAILGKDNVGNSFEFNLLAPSSQNSFITKGSGLKLHRASPFGSVVVGERPMVVFLALEEGHAPVFRWGYARGGGNGHGITLVETTDRKSYKVNVKLIASAKEVDGNPALAHATQALPSTAKELEEKLRKLHDNCKMDDHTADIIQNTRGNVGRLRVAHAEARQTADNLRSDATIFRKAAKTFPEVTCQLPTSPATKLADGMRDAADKLDMLACRVRVAELAKKPQVSNSASPEALYKALVDVNALPNVGEEDKKAVLSCMSEVDRQFPGSIRLLRQHGVGAMDYVMAPEDYTAVIDKCSTPANATNHSHKIATNLVIELATNNETTVAKWASAKALNKRIAATNGDDSDVSENCRDAVDNIIDKMTRLACRVKYIEALGQTASSPPETANDTLARKVVLELFNTPETRAHYIKDPELSNCIWKDDPPSAARLKLEIGSESPYFDNVEVTALIAEQSVEVEKQIAIAKNDLKKNCTGKEKTLALEASSDGAFLEPLLRMETRRPEVLGLLSVLDNVERSLKTSHQHGETYDASNQRETCLRSLEKYRDQVMTGSCRIRLMERLKAAGSDTQLAHAWLRRQREDPGSSDNEVDETDELCVRLLDPRGAQHRSRWKKQSLRTCKAPAAQAAAQEFCRSLSQARVPFNFVDFLSLLLIAALPLWPATKTELSSSWLGPRQQTLAHKTTGARLACSSQKTLIESHGVGQKTSDSYITRKNALEQLLKSIASGVSLIDITQCACSSKGIAYSYESREETAKLTVWYSEAGSALIKDGNAATKIVAARARMVENLLAKELSHVSWLGHVRLVEGHSAGKILETLWFEYLSELFTGNLRVFWDRILETNDDAVCRLAMADTFFFVVGLDLSDVCTSTNAHEAVVLNVATDVSKLDNLPRDAIKGLSFAVVSAALGGRPGLAQAALAVLPVGYLFHMGKQTLDRVGSLGRPSPLPGAPGHADIFKQSLKSLYESSFVFKQRGVSDVIVKLAAKAMAQAEMPNNSKFSRSMNRRRDAWQGIEKSSKRQKTMDLNLLKKLTPPSFYPLAPPGGNNPPFECNEGLC